MKKKKKKPKYRQIVAIKPYSNVTVVRTRPTSFYQLNVKYDFLQYTRVVYKWAMVNHDLRRDDVDILLYLYPRGLFTKEEFYKYAKIIRMSARMVMKHLVDSGWIKVYRDTDKSQDYITSYRLTTKAVNMCRKMHEFCMGDHKMTENVRYNKIYKHKEKATRDYMTIIKEMNSREKINEQEET